MPPRQSASRLTCRDEKIAIQPVQSGFTLVELTIVLVIVALLIGGMLLPLSAQRDLQNAREAQRQLSEIKETLLGYTVITGHLPCPMPVTVTALTDAGYGIAPATCAAGAEGILPWKTLSVLEVDPWGTPRSASTDSFNGYWRYRVDTAFAATFSLTTAQASALSVVDNTGNTLTSAAESPIAIVFSTGPDLAANGENGNLDPIYQYGERTQNFDDLLIWIGRPLLFNKMLAAGKLTL